MFTGTCNLRGKPGHKAFECRSKGKGKGKGKQGKGQQWQPWQQYQQPQQFQHQSYRQWQPQQQQQRWPGNCNRCGRYGHKAVDCRCVRSIDGVPLEQQQEQQCEQQPEQQQWQQRQQGQQQVQQLGEEVFDPSWIFMIGSSSAPLVTEGSSSSGSSPYTEADDYYQQWMMPEELPEDSTADASASTLAAPGRSRASDRLNAADKSIAGIRHRGCLTLVEKTMRLFASLTYAEMRWRRVGLKSRAENGGGL